MVLSALDDHIVDGSCVVESLPRKNPGQLWTIEGVKDQQASSNLYCNQKLPVFLFEIFSNDD